MLAQVRRRQLLLAVLAPAHEIQVMGARRRRRAQPRLIDPHGNTPPLSPMRERHEIAPISVEVEQIGVKVADAKFHVGSHYNTGGSKQSSGGGHPPKDHQTADW